MNNKRTNKTFLLAASLSALSLYCGGFNLDKPKGVDERFEFEGIPNDEFKRFPGHYDKLKHMSAKKRKKYLAKKRKNNKGGSNTHA